MLTKSFVLAGFLAAVGSASAIADGATIVDGDTLDFDGVRFRLNGIDAPETGQKCGSPQGEWPCGKAAIEQLAQLAEGKTLRCQHHSNDGYGRTIATCYVGDTDIGAAMVRLGYAWAFVKYSDVYVAEERLAQSEKAGIWQGPATPAWEFREERWNAESAQAPEGCPIKGNISENGMIYHPPWSPWYSRTRINKDKGERWFCSETAPINASRCGTGASLKAEKEWWRFSPSRMA